ncbi:MAG: DNA-directed RNA polymerase subunit omega [Omnitrophica bacterium RBG_13_46_9]|nr:MAG: DNA-directed RNA polymerase subunit omega [Omnitrophica bacterium RBG_13_46_9]
MENLLRPEQDSVYKMVILASRRALELGAGSEKLVETDPNEKLTSVALKEIIEKKVSYKIKKES